MQLFACRLTVSSMLVVSLCVSILVALAAAPASAQTDPRILTPFMEGRLTELHLDAYLFNKGGAEAGAFLEAQAGEELDSTSASLTVFEGRGRVKLDQGRAPIRLGFEATHLSLDFGSSSLSEDLELIDHSLAIAFPLGEFDNLQIAALLGAGFAGDDAYGNSNAWYGKADLIFNYILDELSSVQFIIDYNGNRTIFPDLPLPAIAYTRTVNERLYYSAGIPFSQIHWEPADRLALDVRVTLPFNADVTLTYRLFDGVSVFGALENRRRAFHIDGDDRNRRMFFVQRRVEAGVRWRPCEYFEVLLAGGWAFHQEFRYGFDSRDDDQLFELSDEPYIRIGGALNF